ncbi:MAG TPA: GspH/FimT family pseudopilin [Gemmatimonadales bacterium]|nr:GspH/FimT family pseudopilin [Gemmatimonadales bacterium]
MRRLAGFTIIETMIAVVIVAIMSVMAYPKLRNSMIKANVRGARNQVANMLTAARTTSEQSNRSTTLIFSGNVARIEASPRRKTTGSGTVDTVGTLVNLNTVYGTTVTLSNGATQVAYNPRGLTSLGNTDLKITLTRSGYTDSVRVDKLGRVRK